mmetsp:Transcript_146746/g.470972  ORF Transcript_146746/g.470972 Transcript_146746/m.470972 type:complete len:247 (-) Transcript_146746:1010-1750(-)
MELARDGVSAIGVPTLVLDGALQWRAPEAAADAAVLVDAKGADPIPFLQSAGGLQSQPQLAQALLRGEPAGDAVVLVSAEGVRDHGGHQVQEEVSPIVCDHALGRVVLSLRDLRRVGHAPGALPSQWDDGASDDVVRGVLPGVEVGHGLPAGAQLAVKVQQVAHTHAPVSQLHDLGVPSLTLATFHLLLGHMLGALGHLEAAGPGGPEKTYDDQEAKELGANICGVADGQNPLDGPPRVGHAQQGG